VIPGAELVGSLDDDLLDLLEIGLLAGRGSGAAGGEDREQNGDRPLIQSWEGRAE
jgi:hypothetical protein